MMYKITRNKVELGEGDPCGRNWPLIVSVEAETPGADPNVFVYHSDPDSRTGAMFSNVASIQDMDIIGVGETTPLPDEDGTENNIPFFRTNTLQLDFYNIDELARCWSIIRYDIAKLAEEYKKFELYDLGETEVTTV